MTDAAHPQSRSDRSHRVSNIGHFGHPRAALKWWPYVLEIMAITQPDTTTASALTQTVDLGSIPELPLPRTATPARVTVYGDRRDYELVVEREHTWIVEGRLAEAEVTGVYDGESIYESTPSTVPRWLEVVLSRFGIDEVSI